MDLSHWDIAENFTIRDISCLIVGVDPSSSGADKYNLRHIEERLLKAFKAAVDMTEFDIYSNTYDEFNEDDPRDSMPDHVALYSEALLNIFREFHEYGNDSNSFDTWRALCGDGRGERFSRNEVAHWLHMNGIKSIYKFNLRKTATASENLLEKVRKLEEVNSYLGSQVTLLQLRPQAANVNAKPEERRWPWGNHTTPELEVLREVAPMFWADGKIEDEADVPTNDEFAAKLMEHGLPKHKANNLASMFRPSNLPMGRRRKV